MAKGARSISLTANHRSSRGVAIAALALVLAGCARSAPDLPPDVGSVKPSETLSADRFSEAELALGCAAIDDEQRHLVREASKLTGVIEDNRAHNQAVGYFGGLFLVPLVAARTNEDEKAQLDRMQAHWDTLELLKRYKSCEAPAAR
jgi:hypothetical protein